VSDRQLERRDLLRIAAGAALLGDAACARQKPAPETAADVAGRLDPAAADAMLGALDRRMASLASESMPEDVLPLSKMRRSAEFEKHLAEDSALVRQSIRTLYITGRFLDMPDEMKVHPGTQSRMWAMQTEMDQAVLGMTERLERMTPEDHRRVQKYLKDDEMFGERLAKVLERTAVDDGLSFSRSFGVRSSVLQLSQRMAAQSPTLVVDPLVSKVRRIQAHPRSDAEEVRRMAARIGEEAFWAHQERIALLHDAWAQRLGSAGVIDSEAALARLSGVVMPAQQTAAATPADPAASPPPSRSTKGSRILTSGAIVMGLGLGSVVVGLIFAGLASATSTSSLYIPALIFGATIGPILLAAGLICLIVGAIVKAGE
jgi:hypothetical protein